MRSGDGLSFVSHSVASPLGYEWEPNRLSDSAQGVTAIRYGTA
jgi:hypothetical protein